MIYTVYLVGTLSEDPATHEWREEAEGILIPKGFRVINPAAAVYDRKIITKADGDTEKFYKLACKEQSQIFLPKSFNSVVRSEIILANLAIEPVGRPMIGSIMEIAWGWQLNKTIIAVRGDNFYSLHPEMVRAIDVFVDSVKQGCRIIIEYFVRKDGQ